MSPISCRSKPSLPDPLAVTNAIGLSREALSMPGNFPAFWKAFRNLCEIVSSKRGSPLPETTHYQVP